MNPRQIFGGILSVTLLLLFLSLLWWAFGVSQVVIACASDASCASIARAEFSEPMQMSFNTIGGLIAAIVVAELSITKPTEAPAARLFAAPGATQPSSWGAKAASIAYLCVWVLTGLGAYVWSALLHPDALKSLTDYGNGWFGLAIASGYAYFGVNRAA
jgi:hypothetical protein